jgi:hypothetical protein
MEITRSTTPSSFSFMFFMKLATLLLLVICFSSNLVEGARPLNGMMKPTPADKVLFPKDRVVTPHSGPNPCHPKKVDGRCDK